MCVCVHCEGDVCIWSFLNYYGDSDGYPNSCVDSFRGLSNRIGGLHEDPDGDPHGVSAWTMGFPEEMAMEIPAGILIPMQIHTHGDSIPAEMRRGHLSSHWDPNGSSIPAGMPVVSGAGPPRARGRPGRGASLGTFEPARESC